MSIKRVSIAILIILVVLAVGMVSAVLYGKSWFVDKCVEKARSQGWELMMSTPEIGWDLSFSLASVKATSGEYGVIELQDFRTDISLDLILSRALPEKLHFKHILVELSKDNLDQLKERFSGHSATGTGSAGGWKLPKSVSAESGLFMFHLPEGVCRFEMNEFEAGRLEGRSFNVAAQGTLHVPATKHTKEFNDVLGFRLNVGLDAPDYSLQVDMDPPASIGVLYDGIEIAVSFDRVEAKTDAAFSAPHVGVSHLAFALPEQYPVTELSMDGIQVFAKRADSEGRWDIESVSLNHPGVAFDLTRALEDPAFRESLPSFLVEKLMAQAASGDKKQPAAEKKKKDKDKVPVKPAQISPEQLKSVKLAIQKVQSKISSLPSIFINEGSLKLHFNKNTFVADALSFDTSSIHGSDAQHFEFAFHLRGAEAQFKVGFPDVEDAFPEVSLQVQKLSASDVFTLLGIPKPDSLGGYLDTRVSFTADERQFQADFSGALVDFALYQPKISSKPIHDIQMSAEFHVNYDFRKDSLVVEPIKVSSGPVTVSAALDIQNLRSEAAILSYRIWAKDIPCEDISKALPPGLLPTIEKLELSGSTMSPGLKGKWPFADPIRFTLIEDNFVNDCHVTAVEPYHTEILNDPQYTFTFTQYTSLANGITVGPGSGSFTPLNQIPSYARAAMYLTEDKRFFDHGPVRTSFIERAMRLNIQNQRYVYGGSTISQQLVKNIFLNRNKNLARKLEEVFIAWNMEDNVPKERIFELYINMIEFGPDVYGITSASHFYFNKTPAELTPVEAAYLASLKVSPSKGGKFYKYGFPQNRWWNKRIKYILQTLAENGYIAPAEIISEYPWIPVFYKPDLSDTKDYRNVWLKTH